jgi:hypothetical protein
MERMNKPRFPRFYGECAACLDVGHLIPVRVFERMRLRLCFACRTGGAGDLIPKEPERA